MTSRVNCVFNLMCFFCPPLPYLAFIPLSLSFILSFPFFLSQLFSPVYLSLSVLLHLSFPFLSLFHLCLTVPLSIFLLNQLCYLLSLFSLSFLLFFFIPVRSASNQCVKCKTSNSLACLHTTLKKKKKKAEEEIRWIWVISAQSSLSHRNHCIFHPGFISNAVTKI